MARSRADIFRILESSGVPTAYRSWGEGKAPKLPYAVYFFVESADVMADNANYARIGRWCAELYSRAKDDESEAAIEAALSEGGIAFAKNEIGPVKDGPYMTAWYFTAV